MNYKKFILTCVLGLGLLTGCNANTQAENSAADYAAPKHEVVLSLSSSITEIWLLAGGSVAGVTSDALEGRDLGLPDTVEILGTIKDPVTEKILDMEPDLVLMSPDISSHVALAETLRQTGISYYMAKVETLDEYLTVLDDFTKITGDTESFKKNGEAVKQETDALLKRVAESERDSVTALFLRAYSSGVKAKATEHTVCTILEDIGVTNVALKEGFPLEEISMEAILEADPDFIFVVPMGDEEAAKAALEESLVSNPAFGGLTAAQNGNLIMLPKELYHYKPNNKWGEAYENIIRIVYPQIFAKSC